MLIKSKDIQNRLVRVLKFIRIMKKIINYSILAFTLLIFGCQDNFLDEPTSSIIDPEILQAKLVLRFTLLEHMMPLVML